MRRSILLLFLLLGLSSPSFALMLEFPFESIARDADAVLEGRVLSQRSYWNEAQTTILTDVLVQVSATVKGDAPAMNELTVRVEGGVVGDVGIWAEHQARFRRGEQVILFLAPSHDGSARRLLHLEQGKFTVAGDTIIDFKGRPRPRHTFTRQIEAAVGE